MRFRTPSTLPAPPNEAKGACTCPLCGESAARLRFVEGTQRVQDCTGCGVTYVSPRRDAAALIEEIYGADYWCSRDPGSRGYGDYAADGALYRKTFERRWNSLAERLPATGRALDVGCAAGYFLEHLERQGFEAWGIEPSASMARLARTRVPAQRVEVGTLRDSALPAAAFDLISLWDVLEHLPSPIDALCRVRRWLAPGGRVLLETQDISSPMARLCGKRWQHFKHDEHLVHFNPATLARACAQAGLAIVHVQRRGAGKYVRGDFLVERSARLHPLLPRLLGPILGGDRSFYVNPGDELIVLLEARR